MRLMRERSPQLTLRGLLAAAALLFATGCAPLMEALEHEAPEEADAEIEAEAFDPEDPATADDLDEDEAELREAARAEGLDPDDPLDAAVLEEPESPLATRRVHFAFDSSEIRDEDVPVLEAHGAFLEEHPDERITVEGHTDERGSREYNLALGERRAESVARLLRANGARTDQIEIVSYGEEDPLVSESNEDAWAENRRAELIYER